MLTTIDDAGRIVSPKSLRERAGLRAGVPLDVELVRGRIEIVPAVTPTRIQDEEGVAVLVPANADPVSADAVRHAQEMVRGGG